MVVGPGREVVAVVLGADVGLEGVAVEGGGRSVGG